MKFNHRILGLLCLIACLSLFSCNKDDSSDETSFNISSSDVTETGFLISWSSSETISQVKLEVSLLEDLSNTVYEHNEDQPGITSHPVEGLNGATVYYFRVTATLQDGSTVASGIKKEETRYTSESVTIDTPDGMELSAKLSYLSYLDQPRPAIIFMHEMGVFVNNWKAAHVVKKLIAEGYVCLVLDFRGHGNSTPIPDLGILISDWSLLQTDLHSTIAFLKNNPRVDSSRLALAGGSLGAIMSLAGNGYDEVISSVALSPAKMGVFEIFPDHTLSNVLYIVGELDIHESPSVNFPAESQYLYDLSEEPKQLMIIEGNGSHGTNLLESTGVEDAILQWIKAGFEEE